MKLGPSKEDVRAFFAKVDPSGSGLLSYEKFRDLLLNIEPSLTDQEVSSPDSFTLADIKSTHMVTHTHTYTQFFMSLRLSEILKFS